MNLPGRRTFIAASVLLLLVAGLHTIGHFTYKPTDPELLEVQKTLMSHHFPMGMGMSPSLFEIQNSLALTMSVTLFWLALLGILVATADASPQVLRRITVLNVAGCGALVLLYAHPHSPAARIVRARRARLRRVAAASGDGDEALIEAGAPRGAAPDEGPPCVRDSLERRYLPRNTIRRDTARPSTTAR